MPPGLALSTAVATAGAVVLVLAAREWVRERRTEVARLAAALRRYGFLPRRLDRSGLRRRVRARLEVGGHDLEVRLDVTPLERTPRLCLELDARLDPGLRLQIHFGDQTRWLLGDAALAAAVSSGRVREAARPGDELHVGDGRLTFLSCDPAGAGLAVIALDEIARRLRAAGPGGIPALLEETAIEDPDPWARADATGPLLALRPELGPALAHDPAPEVRLAVARAVGGEAGFALAAEILTSEIFHVEMQQAALRYLLSRHGPAEVGPVLVGALATSDDNLQGALVTAIRALARPISGWSFAPGPAEEPGCPRLAMPPPPAPASARAAVRALRAALPTAALENAARIAEALAELEGPDAEPTLIALLDRLPDEGPDLPSERELGAVVADALGRVGTQASLPALRRLAKGVAPESSVGIAVKVAVDLVRARYGAADLAGALALAGETPVEGRLSPSTSG